MISYARLSRSGAAAAVYVVGGVTVLVAALAPVQGHLGLLNVGLVFVLFVLGAAAIWGRNVGIAAALLANLALNFFFVEPLHTLSVGSGENLLALLVFLSVSVIGGTLVANARASAKAARLRERETAALLRLNRAMLGKTDPRAALQASCHELVSTFQAAGAAVLDQPDGEWRVIVSDGDGNAARLPDTQERVMAQQAAASGQITGLGHTGLLSPRRPRIVNPLGRGRREAADGGVAFVPLRVADRSLGVLRVDGPLRDAAMRARAPHLLPVFTGETALALHRVDLARAAAHAEALQQADDMKAALLASISHDLKTPIAGIKTAASSLRDGQLSWSDDDRALFLETIETQADRLNRVISDMLDLTRIEAGALAPSLQRCPVAELVQEALERAAESLTGHPVDVRLDDDLELMGDEMLIVQALANLLENAARYSPPGAPVLVRAVESNGEAEIRVEDGGDGINARDLPFIFDRFYRGESGARARGSGLGLAIVRGFVQSCGGAVHAENLARGGAAFVVRLPLPAQAAARVEAQA